MDTTEAKQNNQPDELTDEILDQVTQVRDSGETNMFDTTMVQRIAYDMGLFELVNYLERKENRKAYFDLILHGKRPQDK